MCRDKSATRNILESLFDTNSLWRCSVWVAHGFVPIDYGWPRRRLSSLFWRCVDAWYGMRTGLRWSLDVAIRDRQVARRFPSVRSECGDAHWELRTGSYRSVTADRAGIRFRCLGLEAMRDVRCAQDLGGCRSMVVPLELRGTSSFFADNRLRWVSRSPVFVIWQYNIEDVKWKWDWLVRRLSPVYILVSVPTSKHND